ncbi:helix-turn-helix domain-containing protein [Kineococcus sp. SYSU DK005]|uniref:helix-turn-helix domain-containing protein n=1 Tax=Kineococcus sp. SYSU DK005 TaxID=3383126 RepID=UPI003D7C790C
MSEDAAPATTAQHWRAERGLLNQTRAVAAHAAAGLYPPAQRLEHLPFLSTPRWLAPAPIPLDALSLQLREDEQPAVLSDTAAEAAHVRPLSASGVPFTSYTDALAAIARPATFEDRPAYRLLDVDLSAAAGRLTFSVDTYFRKLGLAEACAHESSRALHASAGAALSWADLPLRQRIGDPFDLTTRSVVPDVQTLTLRRSRARGGATFLVHWRDPAKVATNAGLHGLVPTGEFQPTTGATATAGEQERTGDFDLWHTIVKELSEEVLGRPERGGEETPVDYEHWPFLRTLQQARTGGRLQVHFLGIGVDPLTLAASIMTVAVFDDDLFDQVFADAVAVNAEGVLTAAAGTCRVSDGFPFTEQAIAHLLHGGMTPPSAATLHRAWTLRRHLIET